MCFQPRGADRCRNIVIAARKRQSKYASGISCSALFELGGNALHLAGYVDERVGHPVISLLSEQEGVTQKGATMRLGAYPCEVVLGTKAHQAYGVAEVSEQQS